MRSSRQRRSSGLSCAGDHWRSRRRTDRQGTSDSGNRSPASATGPGSSGTAAACPAVVGINTAGATVSNTGGGSIGLGFAIPIDFARGVAHELIAKGEVTRPSFGMQVQSISPELAQAAGRSAGLFVAAVTAGGAADKAGLRPGDVIVEIDGEPAASVDDLVVKTLRMRPGDVVHLTYERLGASHKAALRLSAE